MSLGARLSPRLQYLSPEELEGGPIAADRRSDVYGLALILYDTLTGRLPYLIDDPEFEQLVLAGAIPIEPLAALPAFLREVISKWGSSRRPDDQRFCHGGALPAGTREPRASGRSAQVAELCAKLIPEASPERSGRAQMLRELGFPPGHAAATLDPIAAEKACSAPHRRGRGPRRRREHRGCSCRRVRRIRPWYWASSGDRRPRSRR